MFAQGDQSNLRKRLAVLKREEILKKISTPAYENEASEILVALKKMGEELSEEEQAFLDKRSSSRHLEEAVDSLGKSVGWLEVDVVDSPILPPTGPV